MNTESFDNEYSWNGRKRQDCFVEFDSPKTSWTASFHYIFMSLTIFEQDPWHHSLRHRNASRLGAYLRMGWSCLQHLQCKEILSWHKDQSGTRSNTASPLWRRKLFLGCWWSFVTSAEQKSNRSWFQETQGRWKRRRNNTRYHPYWKTVVPEWQPQASMRSIIPWIKSRISFRRNSIQISPYMARRRSNHKSLREMRIYQTWPTIDTLWTLCSLWMSWRTRAAPDWIKQKPCSISAR